MRNRLERVEKRAYKYQDRIRGHIRQKHTHLAVNAAIAHLQGELSKLRRYKVVRGERVDVALAGLIERFADEAPALLIDSRHPDNSTWALMEIFEQALRTGEISGVVEPLPYRDDPPTSGGSTHA